MAKTFIGAYESHHRDEAIFHIYRDDNGCWIHFTSKRDNLIAYNIRIEIDNETAKGMGEQLILCSKPLE